MSLSTDKTSSCAAHLENMERSNAATIRRNWSKTSINSESGSRRTNYFYPIIKRGDFQWPANPADSYRRRQASPSWILPASHVCKGVGLLISGSGASKLACQPVTSAVANSRSTTSLRVCAALIAQKRLAQVAPIVQLVRVFTPAVADIGPVVHIRDHDVFDA